MHSDNTAKTGFVGFGITYLVDYQEFGGQLEASVLPGEGDEPDDSHVYQGLEGQHQRRLRRVCRVVVAFCFRGLIQKFTRDRALT